MNYNIIVVIIFCLIILFYNCRDLKFKKIYKIIIEKINLFTSIQLKILNKKKKNHKNKKNIKKLQKQIDDKNDEEVLQKLLNNKNKKIEQSKDIKEDIKEDINDELSEISSLDLNSINSDNSTLLSFE